MAVKKKVIIIIINERGRFAYQAYIESATAALSDKKIKRQVGMAVCVKKVHEPTSPYLITTLILFQCRNRVSLCCSHGE